jgi:flagellar biosynthesis/type III secretory pathway protein FliH
MEASYQAGYQAASDKFNAQLLTMRQEMQQHAQGVLNRIEEAYGQLSGALSRDLPDLITAGVYQIVGQQAMEPQVLCSRINAIVTESCPENEPVEVQLNPQDFESLKNIDPNYASGHPRMTFSPNEKLQRGDCLMETKFGRVDAKLKTQLARLHEELANT